MESEWKNYHDCFWCEVAFQDGKHGFSLRTITIDDEDYIVCSQGCEDGLREED